MNNTGVFNPSGSLIFLFLLLLPAAFHILKAMMSLGASPQALPTPEPEPEDYASSINIGKIVYNNKLNVTPQKKSNKNKLESFGVKEIKRRSNKKNKTTPKTPKNIAEDAISALTSLGFGKRKAKDIVNKMCNNTEYYNVSNLIKDCFNEDNPRSR